MSSLFYETFFFVTKICYFFPFANIFGQGACYKCPNRTTKINFVMSDKNFHVYICENRRKLGSKNTEKRKDMKHDGHKLTHKRNLIMRNSFLMLCGTN